MASLIILWITNDSPIYLLLQAMLEYSAMRLLRASLLTFVTKRIRGTETANGRLVYLMGSAPTQCQL